jgi:MSHA biogenesis protein MshK
MKKNISAKPLVFTVLVIIGIFAEERLYASTADPTRPLGNHAAQGSGASNTEAESIIVSSILIRSDRKLAVINGKTLKEKETIPGVGAQVKKIDADSVTLQRNNRIWRVSLNKTAVRQ